MSIPSDGERMSLPSFRGVALSGQNTFGLPCQASKVLQLASESDLAGLCQAGIDLSSCVILGSGSNVILPPVLEQPVIQVRIMGVGEPHFTPDAILIEAGAGESWHGFVTYTVMNGWGGLENLALIPGTVGASPVQNIGAYGVELEQRVQSVTAWHVPSASVVTLDISECGFAYRDSVFKRSAAGTWIILRVLFRLPIPWKPVRDYPDLRDHPTLQVLAENQVTPKDIFEAVCEIRRRKLPDPSVLGNAGSFFKNPVVPAIQRHALVERFPLIVSYPQADGSYKLAAGWLIEQCGWKGRRVGAVGMHERQALVMVNYGRASAKEVLDLAQQVQQSVRERFGVELEMEPQLIGHNL
jgi:UDP-N-acetylmuramate dehydrogenase